MPPAELSPTYTGIFFAATTKGKHYKSGDRGTSKACRINPLLSKLVNGPE